MEDIAGEEIDPRFTRAVSVQSPGGDEADAAASCFAGALAQLTDGITLRSYSNVDLTPDRAVEIAREELEATAERSRRPGAHPADMRRHLAALLQQRRDLGSGLN